MVTKETAPPAGGEGSAFSVAEPVAWYLQNALSEEVDAAATKAARVQARNIFRTQLGLRCKQARGRMEIADAAKLIGVHRNTIWNIERGDSLPDAFELDVIARVYKTTADWLLTGQAAAAPVNREHQSQLLRDVVSAVLGALQSQELELPTPKVAQLVDLIYEHESSQAATPTENGVQSTTKKFLRLVA